jgi:hypothetical protein
MTHTQSTSFTSFDGHRRLAFGTLQTNALAIKRAFESGAAGPVLIFSDDTGRSVDVDIRGTDAEVFARLAAPAPTAVNLPSETSDAESGETRGRGRPRLGVVAREVTLLPRHWEWLAAQPGGASVVLRKLVEEARRASGDQEARRKAQERAYHFMSAMAGDMAGFEEASRALFANDKARFCEHIASWPEDVRDHAVRLAFGEISEGAPSADK